VILRLHITQEDLFPEWLPEDLPNGVRVQVRKNRDGCVVEIKGWYRHVLTAESLIKKVCPGAKRLPRSSRAA